jgi:tetratricopeptide (TPR) repeat protein
MNERWVGLPTGRTRPARAGPVLLLFLALPGLSADSTIDALMENGHWKRARAAAEAAVHTNPNDARTNYYLARVREQFGNLDDGIKYAELAVKLDAKLAVAHRTLAELWGDKAEKVSLLKQIPMAHKIRSGFETAVALDPKDVDNLSDLITFYLEAPGIAGGDRQKAAELAEQVAKLDAANGCFEMSRVAQKDKHPFDSEGCYQKAVDANPRSYLGRLMLARYYFSQPHVNYDSSVQHARAALDCQPDRTDAFRMLAMALTGQHHFDEVAALLGRAESAIPDDLSPYVAVARVLLRDNVELPRAEAYLKKYIEKTQEPEANTPHLAGAHWSLALVYEKEGRKAEAVAELQTSVKLKPDFEPAQKDLKRLK